MKNALLLTIFITILFPTIAFATPVSWDFASGILRPLQSMWSSEVKVPYITATSTTATSTFPKLSVTNRFSFGGISGTTWSAFCTAITGGAGLCDGTDATGGGGGGTISTSTVPVAGRLAFWTSLSALSSVATGTLSETVSGLQFDATRGLVGGSAILSLTSGFSIPLSASTSAWVMGPVSATDNAVARFDTATGKLIQNSTVTISDVGGIVSTIAAAANAVGLTINQNDTTNNPDGISVVNAGTGNSIFIDANGDTGTSASVSGAFLLNNTDNVGTGANFYSNGATVGVTGLIFAKVDNSSASGPIARFDNDGTGNALNIKQNGNTGTGDTTSGALNINHAGTGFGLNVNTTSGAGTGALVKISASNALIDQALLQLTTAGTHGAATNIRMDGPTPQIEMVETDAIAPAGKFETGVNGNVYYLASRNAGDSSYEIIIDYLSRVAGGGQRMYGATSGSTKLVPSAAAGTTTITMPALTGTMALLENTQAFTGLKTFLSASSTAHTFLGKVFDVTNAVGTKGMVFQTTGTSTRWVATSTLGLGGGGGGSSKWSDAGSGYLNPLLGEYVAAPRFVATSTTASSTANRLEVATAFKLGADYLTDLTGTGLSVVGNALTLVTTGDWTGTFDGIEGSAYLARVNHTGTQLAATISDFVANARTSISETITGLTYTSGTGVLSIDAGYNIPLTASTTNWNTFRDTPSTRITAGTNLSWTGNTLNATGGGSSATSSILVCATGCTYTSIQTALDAGYKTIQLKAETYAGAISIPASDTTIRGAGMYSTLITCAATASTDCVKVATTSSLTRITLEDFGIDNTLGTFLGNGLNTSNTSNVYTNRIRITEFNLGHKVFDTNNTTFYSAFYNMVYFDNSNCFSTGGTLANANTHYNPRCRISSATGVGFNFVNTEGWVLVSPDIEPGSIIGTGLYVDGTSIGITVINPWFEANATGTEIRAGALNTTLIGGRITGSTRGVYDAGTRSKFDGTLISANTTNIVNPSGVNQTFFNAFSAFSSPSLLMGTSSQNSASNLLGLTISTSDTNANIIELNNKGAFATSPIGIGFTNTSGGFSSRIARIFANPGSGYTNPTLTFAVADTAKVLQTRMTIDQDGDVGIGTTTPFQKLTVEGGAFIRGSATTTGDVSFMGEIKPDGALCTNGQILKKTGANDWDCATDATGGGGGTWDTIGDAVANGAVAMAEFVQTLDWDTGAVTSMAGDYFTLTSQNDATTDVSTQRLFVLENKALSTNAMEVMQRITNSDAVAVVTGLLIDGTGAFTTAIDVSAAAIVTALSAGANNLTGTNWSIAGATGLFSTAGGLTLTGSAANISLGTNYLSGDGGDEGVYVTAAGLVGIATTTPAVALSVVGEGRFSSNLTALGNLVLTGATAVIQRVAITEPSAPATGNMLTYAKNIAGKLHLFNKNPLGQAMPSQDALWNSKLYEWRPTTVTAGIWNGTAGAGAGTFINTSPTNSTLYTQQKRARYANIVTTANQVLGQRSNEFIFWRGDSVGEGGFFACSDFGFDVWTNGGRFFSGLHLGTTVISADPSALNNTVGFAVDAADNGAISFLTRGTIATKASTGFTIVSGKGYKACFYSAPNDTQISWWIKDINAGTEASGVATANLPSNTTFYTLGTLASNGALVPVDSVQLGIMKINLQSDY